MSIQNIILLIFFYEKLIVVTLCRNNFQSKLPFYNFFKMSNYYRNGITEQKEIRNFYRRRLAQAPTETL